jgi:hypothetical protein
MTQPRSRAAEELDSFRKHLGSSFSQLVKAVRHGSGNDVNAVAAAEKEMLYQRLKGSDEIHNAERRMIDRFRRTRRAPRPDANRPGPMSPSMANAMMMSEEAGQPFTRPTTNPLLLEFSAAKTEAMKSVKTDPQLGEDWLTKVARFELLGVDLAQSLLNRAGEDRSEWMNVVRGGEQIQLDARTMINIAQRVQGLFNGKIYDIQDSIMLEVSYHYDAARTEEENEAELEQAKDRLDAKVRLADELRTHLADFGEVIIAVSTHVQQLVDQEGWKAYAATYLEHGKLDYAIEGLHLMLGGAAASIREIPFPGVGAASAALQLAVGQITAKLHKYARDARIEEEKKRLSPTGKVSENALREIYLRAMDRDKTIMATRVLQIQKENMESLWGVVGIGLLAIPVPLVGSTIKAFCLSACTRYYEDRVKNLKESLATVPLERGEEAKELFKDLVLEPALDTAKDVLFTDFNTQCADLGAKVYEAAGEEAKGLADFFKEKYADLGNIAVDALKEGITGFAATIAGKLAIDLVNKVAEVGIAPAVSGGDLRQLLDQMAAVKDEVRLETATQ